MNLREPLGIVGCAGWVNSFWLQTLLYDTIIFKAWRYRFSPSAQSAEGIAVASLGGGYNVTPHVSDFIEVA